MRTELRLARLSAAAALLATCSTPTVAHVPTPSREAIRALIAQNVAVMADGTVVLRFARPFVYATLEAEIQTCSGRVPQHLDSYWIAQKHPFRTAHGPALAVHYKDVHRVVFALGEEVNPYVVRHEHLHHLYPELSDSSVVGMHPDSVFGRSAPCGPLIHP